MRKNNRRRVLVKRPHKIPPHLKNAFEHLIFMADQQGGHPDAEDFRNAAGPGVPMGELHWAWNDYQKSLPPAVQEDDLSFLDAL